MAKVIYSDLNTANSGNMNKAINTALDEIMKLKDKVQRFIELSPNKLKGKGYDAVRKELTMYVDALSKGKLILSHLDSALRAANNSMMNYMEGYSELDDSKEPQVKQEINSAKAMLAWLQSYSTIRNSDGTTSQVRNGSDSQISQYQALIAELEKLDAKLVGLAGEDAKDIGKLQDVETDISKFATAINGVDAARFGGDGVSRKTTPQEYKAQEEEKKDEEVTIAGLKYTKEQIINMDEATVKSFRDTMSREDFIEFIGAAAVLNYKERGGGVLPSVTIAQACLESGYGHSFEATSHNVYGLIGYPGSKPKVNRLRQFDNFYEATDYHASYFEHYPKYYADMLKACDAGDAMTACTYLHAYAGGSQSYGPNCQWIIKNFNLERFDEMVGK